MKKKNIKYDTKRYSTLKNSFTQIANDVFKVVDNPYQFTIYCYLCKNYNGDYQYAFPSLKTIANDCNISVKKAQTTLKELEEDKGLIKKKHLKKEGQSYSNNIYYIYYPIIKEEEEIPNTDIPVEEVLKDIEEGEKEYNKIIEEEDDDDE